MTKRQLPKAPARPSADGAFKWELRPKALQAFNPTVYAKEDEKKSDATISILDVIGGDGFFMEGTTVKRIAAALRNIGDRDVVVNLNSPGGDFFEGMAIYNALREHKGHVTVNVLGLAASAAAVIAMGADTLRVARAGFLMVHNTWVAAVGDRHDLMDIAEFLKPFDQTAVDIFAARSGIDPKEIAKMMDREAWIGGAEAVENGWADDFLAADQVAEKVENEANAALRLERVVDLCLKNGMGWTRSQRREAIQALKTGTPRAVEDVKPTADVVSHLKELKVYIEGKTS